MTVHKIYWKVRDTLVTLGIVSPPRTALRRHAPGTVRQRLVGRGSSRRMRRLSLPALLRF
jgi:hypothetical protein